MEMTKRPIDRRVARTRAMLQQAHISLILEKGYEAITVDDICDAANVGRSTFYAHYTSKDDLRRSGLEHLRKELVHRQNDALAWGADSNLFHQGAAKESQDPDVIAATMAKPGVILRRPIGSNGSFAEHAELPTDLASAGPSKAARKSEGRKAKKIAARPVDKAAERKAALAFEREQKRRELERAREETARQNERERRQLAVDKAQAALDKAEGEHAKRVAAIQAEIEDLEKQSRAEDSRWEQERGRLEKALRRARD